MEMAGKIKIFLIALTSVVVGLVARTIIRSGECWELLPVNLGESRTVLPDAHGFEDMAAAPAAEERDKAGLITASSDHAHFQFVLGTSMRELIADAGRAREPPRFFRLGSRGAARELEVRGGPRDLFPHGLATRGAVLAVVNHRRDGDAVELFAIAGDALLYRGDLRHDLLVNLNDCAFTPSGRRLLCTNWRSQTTGSLLDAAELYLQLPWTNVVSCALDEGEPRDCAEVAAGLQMANGIEVSRDGRRVAVASSTGTHIVIYEHDEGATALREVQRIDTRSCCDNLSWDSQGRLVAACSPKALTFVRYSKRPHERTAPCEVIRIDIDAAEVSTLYLDPTGAETSACSVAMVGSSDELFVGTVHDRGVRVFPPGWEARIVPQVATRKINWSAVLLMFVVLGVVWSVPVLIIFRCYHSESRGRKKKD